MLYKEYIPTKALESQNTENLIRVFDNLQAVKDSYIAEYQRGANFILLLNKKWIIKNLQDFGVNLSNELPLDALHQMLLNVRQIVSLRGSLKGIELLCSVISLGSVTIESNFQAINQALFLDSTTQGYLCSELSDNMTNGMPINYLLDDLDILTNKNKLTITIESKFFNGDYPIEAHAIKETLNRLVPIWATIDIAEVTYIYKPLADIHYHQLLNPLGI